MAAGEPTQDPPDTAEVRMRFPGYHLAEGVVWGMTERILTPVLELLGFAPPRRS